MTSRRESKKPRIQPEDLQHAVTDAIVLPDHLYESIFQFSNAADLCSLDLCCRKFQNLTDAVCWKKLAVERFGIELESGKHSWRRGVALTNPKKHYVMELHDPSDYGWLYGGTPFADANSNIFVHTSDDIDGGQEDPDNSLAPERAMVFRNSSTLSFEDAESCAITPFTLVICGKLGQEIIVTANDAGELAAQRGSRTLVIDWEHTLPEELKPLGRTRGHVALLESETHLIVFQWGYMHLFHVDGLDALLEYASSTRMFDSEQAHPDVPVCWEGNTGSKTTFAYAGDKSRVRIWSLELTSSRIEHVQDVGSSNDSFNAEVDDIFETLVFTNRYVAGSPHASKKILIYDRITGALLHTLSESDDGDESDSESDDEQDWDVEDSSPLMMHAVGDLLISTSVKGNALCVWHMRDGTLLRKYSEAFWNRISAKITDGGVPVTSIVMPPNWHCPAFVTIAGHLTLFAFAESAESMKTLDAIERREMKRIEAEDDPSLSDADDGDY